jgi:hypothetical protein
MLKIIPALDVCEAPRTWIPACAGMTPWMNEGSEHYPAPTTGFTSP